MICPDIPSAPIKDCSDFYKEEYYNPEDYLFIQIDMGKRMFYDFWSKPQRKGGITVGDNEINFNLDQETEITIYIESKPYFEYLKNGKIFTVSNCPYYNGTYPNEIFNWSIQKRSHRYRSA